MIQKIFVCDKDQRLSAKPESSSKMSSQLVCFFNVDCQRKNKNKKTFISAVGSKFVLWLSSNCLMAVEKLT